MISCPLLIKMMTFEIIRSNPADHIVPWTPLRSMKLQLSDPIDSRSMEPQLSSLIDSIEDNYTAALKSPSLHWGVWCHSSQVSQTEFRNIGPQLSCPVVFTEEYGVTAVKSHRLDWRALYHCSQEEYEATIHRSHRLHWGV